MRLFRATGCVAPVSVAPPGNWCPVWPQNIKTKGPVFRLSLLFLFDAWQFMAGVLPAPLRAVAAQRSNPLPADLSYSGERSPTNNR